MLTATAWRGPLSLEANTTYFRVQSECPQPEAPRDLMGDRGGLREAAWLLAPIALVTLLFADLNRSVFR
jgi:hypothetical protein